MFYVHILPLIYHCCSLVVIMYPLSGQLQILTGRNILFLMNMMSVLCYA